jgi:hypothetical protein
MSFVAPWMLAAGLAAALGVVALHLLSTRRPTAALLPTARFVPESDVRAVARTSKPTDLLLLALRALAVLFIGFGFAQPIPNAPGPQVRSVVALEWTTALTDVEAARTEARERLSDGDALVVFDTAARVVDATALDALPTPTVRRAMLSPMYVTALDAARAIARGADSLQLVVLSAHSADAFDAATGPLREGWPGRVEHVVLPAVADTASAQVVQLLPADLGDPLAPALRALPSERGTHLVRIQRGAFSSADSAWLTGNRGAVLLHWPREFADSVRPDGVSLTDASGATLVAPLGRIARSGVTVDGSAVDGALREVPLTGIQVLARWRDGSPAVTESALSQGCVRSVGIGISEAGDLTLRTPFVHFLAGLVTACGGRREVALSASAFATESDTGPLASAASFIGGQRDRSALTPWLLATALLLLLAEQFLRRRQLELRP